MSSENTEKQQPSPAAGTSTTSGPSSAKSTTSLPPKSPLPIDIDLVESMHPPKIPNVVAVHTHPSSSSSSSADASPPYLSSNTISHATSGTAAPFGGSSTTTSSSGHNESSGTAVPPEEITMLGNHSRMSSSSRMSSGCKDSLSSTLKRKESAQNVSALGAGESMGAFMHDPSDFLNVNKGNAGTSGAFSNASFGSHLTGGANQSASAFPGGGGGGGAGALGSGGGQLAPDPAAVHRCRNLMVPQQSQAVLCDVLQQLIDDYPVLVPLVRRLINSSCASQQAFFLTAQQQQQLQMMQLLQQQPQQQGQQHQAPLRGQSSTSLTNNSFTSSVFGTSAAPNIDALRMVHSVAPSAANSGGSPSSSSQNNINNNSTSTININASTGSPGRNSSGLLSVGNSQASSAHSLRHGQSGSSTPQIAITRDSSGLSTSSPSKQK